MDALARTVPGDDSDALLLGVAAHAVGHETLAAELFLRSEEVLRAHGRLAPLSEALPLRVLALLALGDLERTAGLAEESGRSRWCTTALDCGALLKALTGDAPGALRLADRAEPETDRHALDDPAAWVKVARGVAAPAATPEPGRVSAAPAHLRTGGFRLSRTREGGSVASGAG
ncbi:hypothetical protein OHT59_42100 [Streptomyces sp. NBC_00243]|uniref:hypothetical protein n=1 Tax=Streptomyces sp. NBC_00243 TaxID=2975688 RepID=UPI002DD98798|nr:hypothetical protein [Streptomyces sp. NBC_00243]WRZ24653.1 hypothetical protein OHT59_42100 [Streptomyces sp. NBC_00243]